MIQITKTILKYCRRMPFIASLILLAACDSSSLAQNAAIDEKKSSEHVKIDRFTIPTTLQTWASDETPTLGNNELSIVPDIQNDLSRFIKNRADPIAAVMLVSVKTGKVLAMAQGRAPENWGGTTHTALHNAFPAASLFKTVVSAAAFETIDVNPKRKVGLMGGCGEVNARGVWMRKDVSGRRFKLSLRRAYGNSCNDFFAKMAVNDVGLGPILNMSKRLGWNNHKIPADFEIPTSPMKEPNPITSSVHTIGRFAAGFGYVGMSVAHAAWQTLAIANDGVAKPLSLLKKSSDASSSNQSQVVISEATAQKIRSIMDATVLGGTATSAFRRGKYRSMRFDVGGKTGTLTGNYPDGITTWFAGVYPIEQPEVVVAAVTVLDKLWHFKAPNLAAEALWSYKSWARKQAKVASSRLNQDSEKN